jgi:hypothetical protein
MKFRAGTEMRAGTFAYTRRYGLGRRHNSSIRREGDIMGRGILLWLLGVPIPVIILLALIWH